MNTRQHAQSGFTLIELLVVIVMIGVLTAMAWPMYASVVRRARYAEVKQQMGTMAKEISAYLLEKGRYPADTNSGKQPAGVDNWPSKEKIPYNSTYDYDHWGVGGKQCYVQIGYAGESGTRAYPLHTLNQEPYGFKEFDDNLVLGIAVYDCDRGKGAIK
ncbi:MAG: type II secretion system protein [Cyanobacteria bacterium P01_H01_bin.58]